MGRIILPEIELKDFCYRCGKRPRYITAKGSTVFKKCWIVHVNIHAKQPIKYFCSRECKWQWCYEKSNKRLGRQKYREYKKAQQKEEVYSV